VPRKLSLDQGLYISFAGVFCQFRLIVILLVLSLVACSTLSEVVVPPSFDNNVNIDNSVDDSRDASYPSNLNNDEASRIVIVGSYGGLLTNSDGIFHKEDHPPRYELYWDYNVATERLAYASSEYHGLSESTWSVSDFWSFDYKNNVAMRWWSSGVGRVSWDPSSNYTNSRAALIVFNVDHDDFSLGIATSPGRVRMLADHVGHAFSWSPDGKNIMFVSDKDGNPEIYIMDSTGGNIVRLTNNDVRDDQPVWSPDGKQIAFVSYLDGDAEIFVMKSDGSDQRRITNNDFHDSDPAW